MHRACSFVLRLTHFPATDTQVPALWMRSSHI
jgi:hypothetical protein